MTDFVIILTCKSAVDAFSKGGNLTLGGNFTIAAGPLGRNLEGDVAVRSPAAIYTYSKTKGLFAGISIEGSYLVERKDANRKWAVFVILQCGVIWCNIYFTFYACCGRSVFKAGRPSTSWTAAHLLWMSPGVSVFALSAATSSSLHDIVAASSVVGRFLLSAR